LPWRSLRNTCFYVLRKANPLRYYYRRDE
jgi:hypothetical protein